MGSAAMPQLSLACFSPADALRRMEGKQFICETKFDGVQCTCTHHGLSSHVHCTPWKLHIDAAISVSIR